MFTKASMFSMSTLSSQFFYGILPDISRRLVDLNTLKVRGNLTFTNLHFQKRTVQNKDMTNLIELLAVINLIARQHSFTKLVLHMLHLTKASMSPASSTFFLRFVSTFQDLLLTRSSHFHEFYMFSRSTKSPQVAFLDIS